MLLSVAAILSVIATFLLILVLVRLIRIKLENGRASRLTRVGPGARATGTPTFTTSTLILVTTAHRTADHGDSSFGHGHDGGGFDGGGDGSL